MDRATETAPVELVETELEMSKPCKHSVRFDTKDLDAPLSSIYINRSLPGIGQAKKVAVTIRIVE